MQNPKGTVVKQVHAAIGRAAHLDPQLWPIGVDFRDGTLSLDGELPHIAAKKTALRVAAAIDGVRRVVDRLRVSARNGQGSAATRDTIGNWLLQEIDFRNCAIHAVVKGKRETLRQAGSDSCGSIEISVVDGVVTLAGEVISLSHKRLAGVVAWWAYGCRDVINDLAVVPQEDDNDGEIVEALRLVLESDPYVHADRITVDSRSNVVTLSGVVASAGQKARAEMDAWYLYAVNDVVNRLDIG